jgi:hypothetical protein
VETKVRKKPVNEGEGRVGRQGGGVGKSSEMWLFFILLKNISPKTLGY